MISTSWAVNGKSRTNPSRAERPTEGVVGSFASLSFVRIMVRHVGRLTSAAGAVQRFFRTLDGSGPQQVIEMVYVS